MQQHTINDKQHTRVATEILSPTPTALDVIEEASTTIESGNVGEHLITSLQNHTGVISVLLVDDHALMREGLRQLLELEEDMHIVGEAVNGFDAVYKIGQLHPDVVLLDIRMPIIDGIAVARQIAHEFPSIAVIMLTVS